MSYKPEFQIQGVWYDNAQRFGSYEEAEASARARFMSWTMPSGWRVAESSDPVNYTVIDGRDVRLADLPAGGEVVA